MDEADTIGRSGIVYQPINSLGNNDFEGEKRITPLLQNLDSEVIATNVIVNTPEGKEKIRKSIIININGFHIGIVGYLTPETSILDSAGNIEYIDEILALTEEVTNLKKQNVKFIIALGQSRQKDLEIAKEVEGLNLVIAGNTNVFYTNGTAVNEGIEDPDNNVIVTQKSGAQVPVVRSYTYSKYLGKIFTKFDANGKIINLDLDYILLDNSVPQDIEAVHMVESLRNNLKSTSETLGKTAVVLDGTSCKLEECNLGNLVTDSIILQHSIKYPGVHWTDAPIAIIHGGALTGKISPAQRPGDVTRNDLMSVIRMSNNLIAVTMNGAILKEALEHSVSSYTTAGSEGFLQFSGIRVTYNFGEEPGSRIVDAVARCWNCTIPDFFAIEDTRDYKIIMPSALANGGLGYSMFDNLPKESLDFDEVTCLSEFIKTRSPVYPEIADRITLQNTDAVPGSAHTIKATTMLLLALILKNIIG